MSNKPNPSELQDATECVLPSEFHEVHLQRGLTKIGNPYDAADFHSAVVGSLKLRPVFSFNFFINF